MLFIAKSAIIKISIFYRKAAVWTAKKMGIKKDYHYINMEDYEEKILYDTEPEQKKTRIQGIFGNWFGLLMVIICSILIYCFISYVPLLFRGIAYGLELLKPVIYGAVIAYLLNPLMKCYYQTILKLLRQGGKKPSKRVKKVSYGISIGLALISGILIILVLIWMIVPQLITSIVSLANTLPNQAEHYYQIVVNWIQNNPYLIDKMQEIALDATKTLDDWMQNALFPWLKADLLPNVNSFAFRFANGVMSILGVLYNLFIGSIVAVYMLGGKEKFLAQGKKLIFGIFGKKQADVILHYSRITNDMFSGFISGKIVDSTIIGIICFVAMSVLKLPYALLISVIVGVTNVIPVFGPYIGAIPSALLILLVSPVQSLYFVIMIIVLQQLDGNVIGPAILGESTGLTAFWVLFSILLFGGMWGIPGMVVGVPLFAVIYRLVKDYIELRLFRKQMHTNTLAYVNLKNIQTDREGRKHYTRFTPKEQRSASVRRKAEEKFTLITLLYPEQNFFEEMGKGEETECAGDETETVTQNTVSGQEGNNEVMASEDTEGKGNIKEKGQEDTSGMSEHAGEKALDREADSLDQ